MIDGLCAEGVTDLRCYFEESPGALAALPGQIICLDFNQAAADIHLRSPRRLGPTVEAGHLIDR